MIFAALLCFVLHLHTSKVGSVSGITWRQVDRQTGSVYLQHVVSRSLRPYIQRTSILTFHGHRQLTMVYTVVITAYDYADAVCVQYMMPFIGPINLRAGRSTIVPLLMSTQTIRPTHSRCVRQMRHTQQFAQTKWDRVHSETEFHFRQQAWPKQ